MVDMKIEGAESLADQIRRVWAAPPRRTPLPRGVMKFRTVEEAKAFRDEWHRIHDGEDGDKQ